MKCRACNSPCEPGKTIFCVACFESLPGSERANLRKHFLRVRQVCKNPAAFEAGMRDKIVKCIELIKTARDLPARGVTLSLPELKQS